MPKKSKKGWFTYTMAGFGVLFVLFAMFFAVTYGIPSVREVVWTPQTTDSPTDDTTNTDTSTDDAEDSTTDDTQSDETTTEE